MSSIAQLLLPTVTDEFLHEFGRLFQRSILLVFFNMFRSLGTKFDKRGLISWYTGEKVLLDPKRKTTKFSSPTCLLLDRTSTESFLSLGKQISIIRKDVSTQSHRKTSLQVVQDSTLWCVREKKKRTTFYSSTFLTYNDVKQKHECEHGFV